MFGKKDISRLTPVKVTDKRGRTFTVYKRQEAPHSLIRKLQDAVGKGGWSLTEASIGNRYSVERPINKQGDKEVVMRLTLSGSKKIGEWGVTQQEVEYPLNPDGSRKKGGAIVIRSSKTLGKRMDFKDAGKLFVDTMRKVEKV